MKIGTIEGIDIAEMKSLITISSLYPISETLVLSSSGHFFCPENINELTSRNHNGNKKI
ncbi:MAG: hypothetical protein ACTSQ8_15545 [Candidatus Helarchaeota archaeon]